jgi:hypothetical protein
MSDYFRKMTSREMMSERILQKDEIREMMPER